MRRTIALLLLSVAALLFLTGCGKTDEEYARERVLLAKICEDAGGSYELNGWSGYVCDFGRDDR